MRIIKLLLFLSYLFLAVIASGHLGMLAARHQFDIMSRPRKINKEALPPFFVVVAFLAETGKPELVELFEYSALLKEVVAESGLDELSRHYGKIVFKEDEGKYSYAIDPAKRESIEEGLGWDLEVPSIHQVVIRLLPDQESTGEDASGWDFRFSNRDREKIRLLVDQESAGSQWIGLYTRSDEFIYKFIYEVSNGQVTPIAYGEENKSKIATALLVCWFPVFLFSLTVFLVLLRARGYITRKVRALLAKSQTE